MLCFPSDDSLTLPKVLAAVRTMDVVTLMDVLDVPGTKRDEVEQQSASEEEEREGLVKYYVNTHPNASWEHLGGGLLWWKEEEAMKEVKVYIKPTQGEYGVSIDMCQCFASWLGQYLNIHPEYCNDVRYCTWCSHVSLYRVGRGCVPSIDMLPLLTLHCMALYRVGKWCVPSIGMLPGTLLTLHCMALYRVGRGCVPSIALTCYLVSS